MSKTFDVYVTKYALTEGIKAVEVEDCFDIIYSMVHEVSPNGNSRIAYHKGEWWMSLDDAISRAEDMRTRKIKSLKKQIEKLEAIDFRETQK